MAQVVSGTIPTIPFDETDAVTGDAAFSPQKETGGPKGGKKAGKKGAPKKTSTGKSKGKGAAKGGAGKKKTASKKTQKANKKPSTKKVAGKKRKKSDDASSSSSTKPKTKKSSAKKSSAKKGSGKASNKGKGSAKKHKKDGVPKKSKKKIAEERRAYLMSLKDELPNSPMTPWMCFSQDVRKTNAEIQALPFGEKARRAGEMWRVVCNKDENDKPKGPPTPEYYEWVEKSRQDAIRYQTEMAALSEDHLELISILSKKSSKEKKAENRKKKSEGEPKKALAAYMNFVQDKRDEIKAQMPELIEAFRTADKWTDKVKKNGKPPSDFERMGQLLGLYWKDMTDEQRAVYYRRQYQDKERYVKEKYAFDLEKAKKEGSPAPARSAHYFYVSRVTNDNVSDDDYTYFEEMSDEEKCEYDCLGATDLLRFTREYVAWKEGKAAQSGDVRPVKEAIEYFCVQKFNLEERSTDPDVGDAFDKTWGELTRKQQNVFQRLKDADRIRFRAECKVLREKELAEKKQKRLEAKEAKARAKAEAAALKADEKARKAEERARKAEERARKMQDVDDEGEEGEEEDEEEDETEMEDGDETEMEDEVESGEESEEEEEEA